MHGPVLPSSFIGHCEGGVLRFGTTVFFNSEVFSCTYTQCDLYQQACDALPQSTFFVRVSFDAVLEFYRISNSCIYIYILSWMGSWGHSSLKPSAAWGTMQGPSIFFNYKLLAIPNPRSSGGLALEGFGGNCPSAEHAFCLPKAWFNEVLTNELGNDLCLELRLQYELIFIFFLRTKKYPRSGGPKMRASAAYPKGYAARLLKVHRHITVRNSTA